MTKKESTEMQLRGHIFEYEMDADNNHAQSQAARLNFECIEKCLKELNLEYNTKNLAKFGSKRAAKYIEKWPDLG